jgi:tetratricopeptide (TPR) repeat protein
MFPSPLPSLLLACCLGLLPRPAHAGYDEIDAAPINLDPKTGAEADEAYQELLAAGRSQEALDLLPKWLERFPKEAALHGDYGMLLGAINRREDAREQLRLAVELAPDVAAYCYSYGLQLADAEDFDGAAIQFDKANELAPDDPDIDAELEELGLRRRLSHQKEPASPPAEGTASRIAYDLVKAAFRSPARFADVFVEHVDRSWLDAALQRRGVTKSQLPLGRRQLGINMMNSFRESAAKSGGHIVGWDIISETTDDGVIEVVTRGIHSQTFTEQQAREQLGIVRSPLAGKFYKEEVLTLLRGLSKDELEATFMRAAGKKSSTLSAAKFRFKQDGGRFVLTDVSLGVPGIAEMSLVTMLEHEVALMRAMGKEPDSEGNSAYRAGRLVGNLFLLVIVVLVARWIIRLRRQIYS